MGTSHCMEKVVWLRQLLVDVRYVQEVPTSIICNNQGCITLAKNPTHTSHIKHIDVQHHFIKKPRDMFEELSKGRYDSRCVNQTTCKV